MTGNSERKNQYYVKPNNNKKSEKKKKNFLYFATNKNLKIHPLILIKREEDDIVLALAPCTFLDICMLCFFEPCRSA